MNRKFSARAATVLSVAALALTGCGGGGSAAEGDQVTLRFAWWGSDTRHEKTQEMIEVFEEQNPDVEIEAEYGDWSGYWDKLATQTAAGDAPDIIQMDLLYIREYAENGVLLDLSDVDMSDMPEDLRVSGATDEGVWGIPHGLTALSMLANKTMFEEAGVELPDDSTWTWEDLEAKSLEFQEKGEGYGLTSLPATMTLELYLRQNGKEFLTPDGQLGWEPADAEGYFEMYKGLADSGALPSASVIAEDQLPSLDQTLTATNQVAMAPWWSTQMTAVQDASGDEFEILRMPTFDGDASKGQLWYKTSMFFSAAADTDHPEEAKAFIDFLVNSTEAAEIGATERGMLANQTALDHIREDLTPEENQVADYITEIEPDLGEPVPIPPQGVSDYQNLHFRYDLEVLFGRMSPAEAAEQMHAEMAAAL
ncbi:ABC transporter substrate-binding protein [Zhihengliuella salsuginis]|uniref:Sugar ABC transporter substrate-binding protein n=1 Tax=Zhihengliuella salsuginis TaxID=578222 RepID=A0ABQ3GGM5_9MICC|nr:sugar ABC transporter substrate-binding protein [Zhihengliuella salsuginis]GHD05530.1 sugar ABC transporter substrate-binding protein [Zhihengliuella salsuginis]